MGLFSKFKKENNKKPDISEIAYDYSKHDEIEKKQAIKACF